MWAPFLFSLALVQPAPEPPVGWVEGRVVDSVTKQPLRDTLVVLQRTDRPYRIGEDLWRTEPTPGDRDPDADRRSAMTGDDGKFRFRVSLPAKFVLYSEKLGYVRDSAGVRGQVEKADESLQVQVVLVQEARMEGRVVDRESGEPVRGLTVTAYGQWEAAAKGFLIPKGSGKTNEKGEFTIEKLSPGEYFVETRPGINARIVEAGPEKEFRQAVRMGYGPTWYPNASRREDSAPVRILSASTTDRIELQVEKRRYAALRGKLTVDEGAAGTDEITVTLMRLRHGWDSRSYAAEAKGQVKIGSGYEIRQLSPGRYYLMASLPGNTPAERQAADLVFEVTDENLDGMDLHLMRGLTVKGRVRVGPMEGPLPEQSQPMELEKVTVGLSPVFRAHSESDRPVEAARGSGEFVLEGVPPGDYDLWVRAPEGYFLVEAYYNGKRMPWHGFRLERGADRHELEAVLRPSGGSLAVTVTDGTNPQADALVLAIREPVHADAARELRLRAKTDAKGVATIARMPAGSYRVIAFVGGNDWSFDERLLERFRAAPQVKVAGGGQHTVQIRPESQ